MISTSSNTGDYWLFKGMVILRIFEILVKECAHKLLHHEGVGHEHGPIRVYMYGQSSCLGICRECTYKEYRLILSDISIHRGREGHRHVYYSLLQIHRRGWIGAGVGTDTRSQGSSSELRSPKNRSQASGTSADEELYTSDTVVHESATSTDELPLDLKRAAKRSSKNSAQLPKSHRKRRNSSEPSNSRHRRTPATRSSSRSTAAGTMTTQSGIRK